MNASQRVACTFLLLAPSLYANAGPTPVASSGRALSAIVVGEHAGPSPRFAAAKLKDYFRALSGAEIPVITERQTSARPPDEAWILIGGPEQNPLVKHFDGTAFSALNGDSFLLKSVSVKGRRSILAGGNEDAATMYAVFELASQLGVTYRLTGDILPEPRSSLSIPALDLVRKPVVARRGFLLEASLHPSITMLSFEDYRRLLDQMAKMKYNFLEFWWFPYEPWLKYSYRGEAKMIGDVSAKASGYMNSIYEGFGSRTTDDVIVGKEKFPNRRLAAPEFYHVESPEQAFETAQNLLRRVIRYGKSRGIHVWLVDEMAALPPNLARYCERIGELPFGGVFGTLVHPLDPINREIQVARLKAMVETYPEAEGYLLNFSEVYNPLNNAKYKEFFARQAAAFEPLRELKKPWIDWQHVGEDQMIESNIGYFDLFKFLLSKRDEIAPRTKLGLMTVGRGYDLPLFDKLLPKDVMFSNFDSGARAGWTPGGMPMKYYGGMGPRERIDTPYVDDDGEMMGLQFNIGVYSRKDRIFSDGAKYGLTGVAGWMSRIRGSEVNSSYLAQAAWQPQLSAGEFYRDYSERTFGAAAAADMERAFATLEENQDWLSREVRPAGAILGCCGSSREASVMRHYYLQENAFDGPREPDWQSYIRRTPAFIEQYGPSMEILEKALVSLRAAQPAVAPRGRSELAYLINRTESYHDAMRAFITVHRAFVAFDRAFHDRHQLTHEQFVDALEQSLRQCDDAYRQIEAVTTKFAQIADHPADLEILYHLNVRALLAFDLSRQWMRQVANYHEGKLYTKHIPFERLFPVDVHTGKGIQDQM